MVKGRVIVDRYRFLDEVYHEKKDLVGKKIRNITLHSPIDQLYCNLNDFLDRVDT